MYDAHCLGCIEYHCSGRSAIDVDSKVSISDTDTWFVNGSSYSSYFIIVY